MGGKRGLDRGLGKEKGEDGDRRSEVGGRNHEWARRHTNAEPWPEARRTIESRVLDLPLQKIALTSGSR